MNHFFSITLAFLLLAGFLPEASSNEPEKGKSLDNNLLISLVNQHRSRGVHCGDTYFPPVEPLVWNDTIASAAALHSEDMFKHGHYSHYGTDGSDPGERLHRLGYKWSTYSENIALSEWLTEATVIEGWINSPGHCRNIMSGNVTQMGVGRVGGYWTQVLARPRTSEQRGLRK